MAFLFLPLLMNVAVANSQHALSENPYARKHLNLPTTNGPCIVPKNPCISKPAPQPVPRTCFSSRCCVPKDSYICKQLRLPCFDGVEVIGDVDVDIEGGACGQQVEVSGRSKSVRAVVACTKGRTICIRTLAQCRGWQRPKICIRVPMLSRFNYKSGAANITIQKLSPCYPVCMDIQGRPKVTINGNIRLRRLIVGGSSEVSVFWINSCDFYLRATDCAKVCLAGVAKTFEVDAFQSASANARYLHAQRVFVKSHDCSRVDVRASCALNALASEGSYIYSYQNSRFQAPFMQCGGSVVQMTDICCPPNDICDEACCKNGWH